MNNFFSLLLWSVTFASLYDQVPYWRPDEQVKVFCPFSHPEYQECAAYCERQHRWQTLKEVNDNCAARLSFGSEFLMWHRRRYSVNTSEVYWGNTQFSAQLVDLRQANIDLRNVSDIELVYINPHLENNLCLSKVFRGYEVSMERFSCRRETVWPRRQMCEPQFEQTEIDWDNDYVVDWSDDILYDGWLLNFIGNTSVFVAIFNVTQWAIQANSRALKDGFLIHRKDWRRTYVCDTSRMRENGWVEVVDRKWVMGEPFCNQITDCQQCQAAINCRWCITPGYQPACTDYCIAPWELTTC